MSLPNEVIVSTSKLTAIGDAIRSRFGVSGELTLDEMVETIYLPSEYQQVDYIESTGTQYINLNYCPVKTTIIEIDCQFTDTVGATNMPKMGVCSAYKTYSRCNMGIENSKAYFGICDKNVYPDYYDVLSRHIWKIDLGEKKGYIDGVLQAQGSQVFNGDQEHTATLFGARGSSGVDNLCKAKFFLGRIYNSVGSIVLHLIPCYRKSDNEIGLYDLNSGTFYTNQGSGSFTCYPAPPSN